MQNAKMQPIVTDVQWLVCLSLCVCVCLPTMTPVLQQLNQLRRHLGRGLGWAEGTTVRDQIPKGRGTRSPKGRGIFCDVVFCQKIL